MSDPDRKSGSVLVPTMRYRDAKAAVAFLRDAFGFQEKAVYEGKDGIVEHAEMILGNAMIMFGSVRDTPFSKFMRQPGDVGGVTQSIYAVVEDADAHYARAKAAGAEILMEPVTQDYGGRDYTCRDPEGHVWTFGTYDPWKA